VKILRVCLLLVALVLPMTARTVEVMTLDQAVERALQEDPRIEEKERLVDAARGLLQEALGSDDVIFDVNAFLGLALQVDGGFYGPDGVTPRSDKYDWNGLTSWTNLRFDIIKPLYTFGKIEHYAEAAKGNIEVKKGDVALQRSNTILDVNRAYYGYLAARDTRYLFEDVLARVNKAIDLVNKWLAEGNSNARQSDLYALQSGKALISKFLAQSTAVENIALDGLKVLTNVGLEGDLEVADSRIAPVALPSASLAELSDEALIQRPEIKQLEAGLSARRELVEAKKAEKLPDIYAGIAGLAAFTPKRTALDNPFIYDPFNDHALTPLVGIRWNWASGVQKAKVVQAQAELDALVEKSSLAQRGIPFEVAEQYHQVQAYNKSVQELAEGSRAARRWMIATYADFEAGVQDADKVLSAFQGYVLIHSDYLSTVNDYNMHVVRLKYVTGDLL
jgi:outer membrane protein